MQSSGRTLGLLGGMSWESSVEYYRLVNRGVRDRLGGLHSARTLMLSVDFAEVARLQHSGDWGALAAMLAAEARSLAAGGAGTILLCTNTMHEVADAIEAATPGVPLLHIADPTGAAIRSAGLRRVGLLGTTFTMERDFYRRRFAERHGLEVIVPEAADRADVHRIIYDELVRGRIDDASRETYRGVIARLAAAGAEAVILGCTEIGLLVGPDDSPVPLFDTTALHAAAAVDWLVEG